MPKRTWKFSAKWLAKQHECTLLGITTRCHGACCTAGKGGQYWPGRSGADGRCPNLGEEGCVLPVVQRPVTCLLYPLRLNDGGNVGLHQRAMFPTSCCAGNYGHGPRLVDALAEQLTALLGPVEYAALVQAVTDGVDYSVVVDESIAAALAREAEWEAENTPPTAREPAAPAVPATPSLWHPGG